MKRFFVNKQLNINENFVIDGIEHNHIKNVMRMQVGDNIILVCGDDFDYMATIVAMSKGETKVSITDREENIYNSTANVTTPPKHSKPKKKGVIGFLEDLFN